MSKILENIKKQGGWKAKIVDLFYKQTPVAMEGETIIECENLVKIYKVADLEVMALQGLDLSIKKGELMAIIGSSGSGKTTLLNILGGLDSPSVGRVRVAGWDINNLSRRDSITYRRDVVGFVWQNIGRNLIPYLTALENVQVPMILGGKKEREEWARELLTAVGLADRMKHRPLEMSGGQQQRVAIAIGLANKPKVLLADEPTGSLDSKTGDEIVKVFRTVCETFGTTVVLVTHDRGLASAVDRVVEIRDGKITTESVRTEKFDSERYTQNIGLHVGLSEESKTHIHYSVLDSAGRLQIPEEYLKELGIKGRAAMEKGEDCIIIRPPKQNPSEGDEGGDLRQAEQG